MESSTSNKLSNGLIPTSLDPDLMSVLAKILQDLNGLEVNMTDIQNELSALRQEIKDTNPTPREDNPPSLDHFDRRGSVMLRQDVDSRHKELIDNLKAEGHIISDKVYNVMLSVNFMHFFSMSDGATTPKKSFQVNKAKFFERYVKRVMEGSRVLYMFSNPYVAVCLALIVGPNGFVVTEGDGQTVADVKKHYSFLIDSGRLIIVDAKWCDFFCKGYGLRSPYDVIIVPKQYYTNYVAEQLEPENGTAYDPWDDTKLN